MGQYKAFIYLFILMRQVGGIYLYILMPQVGGLYLFIIVGQEGGFYLMFGTALRPLFVYYNGIGWRTYVFITMGQDAVQYLFITK
jgi:hypothetical protein